MKTIMFSVVAIVVWDRTEEGEERFHDYSMVLALSATSVWRAARA